MFGVFIYKVNHDYIPKPIGNPYAPQPSEPSPSTPQGQAEPSANMTTSSQLAVINTTQGIIRMEFFPYAAPNHVKNFINLTDQGFYDGLLFHRIAPGFVIQGGDPNTRGDDSDRNVWGQGGPGYTVNAEFNDIPHKRGTVSMARSSDPNSAGSQFFVVVQDSNFLDKQYTVFGRVVSGMDVVDKIAALQTIGGSGPTSEQPVDIEQARILSIKIESR